MYLPDIKSGLYENLIIFFDPSLILIVCSEKELAFLDIINGL
jgi:hypothetical protein